MYKGLLDTHWMFAVLVLLSLVVSIVVFAAGAAQKTSFGKLAGKLSLFTLIFAHIQFIVGLALYFTSPVVMGAFEAGTAMSDAPSRFYAVEHIAVNIIAIVLITMGRSKGKRAETDARKFRTHLIFFSIALLLLLSRIEWHRLFELPGA